MAYEFRTYASNRDSLPTIDHPLAEQQRQAALNGWSSGLSDLIDDGWEVLAPVPPFLSKLATWGGELMLRRTVA
ncbi:MAG: hypothetical protein JWP61_1875 [Friedmanniella sp.]|jgi:hypothetical protein|nr:hypothetical protein [Friedmanniella sp.]